MKAYCINCGSIQPSKFRPGQDAITNESYEDLCCDTCHFIVATIQDREASQQPSQARAVEPVVRYEPERYDEDRVRMALDSDGDWVRYSDYLIAFATPQAAAQPPAPGEAAREYMTGYSDGREWAGATNKAQPSQELGLTDTKSLLMPATAAPLSERKVATVDMSRLPRGAA